MDKNSRDFKISKFVLEKYGLSDNCNGCEATLLGRRRSHSTSCRRRIESEMKTDNTGSKKIDQRNERIHQAEKPQVVVEEEEEEITRDEHDAVINDGG